MLIQTHQLDAAQLRELDALCLECKQTDGNGVAIYSHLLGKNRGRPANVLYYQDRLVGFLGAFFFHANACEIGLMVAPAYRKKGIASRLMDAIRPLIQAEGVDTLIFSVPHGLYTDALTARGFVYEGSEYQMHRNTLEPAIIPDASLTLHRATHADIETLFIIDEACFPGEKIGMPARILSVLNDASVCLFLIHQNGVPVGKAHLNWQDNGVRLSDIGIMPHARKQGIGGVLLAHCINHALSQKKTDIWLDVESKNQNAHALYTRQGFEIKNAHDYWSIHEFGLTAFLPPL